MKSPPLLSRRSASVGSAGTTSSSREFTRIRYHLDFSGLSILRMSSMFVRFWGLLMYVLGFKKYAARYFISTTMNRAGLKGLYFNFVENCQGGIRDSLRLIADPNNHPILVHCTQGKDRTGLVVALTLYVVGVPQEVILEDYQISRAGISAEVPRMLEEMEEVGLDPSFLDSPPETLKETFEFIIRRYNSVEGFLDNIGFAKEERLRMREVLIDQTPMATK